MSLIEEQTGHRTGKVVAVHLNYPSRCAERGRTPSEASYFLKPTSSVVGSGEVERPEGFELLAFEGEVALVIGTAARRVSPEQGWSHVGWVTASNDLGLQDLRAADKGSNVRSKGADGCTAIGAQLIEASKVRPDGLRVRTWLDGEVVQDDTTDTLLFSFGHLIADLSRTMTLEPGDVILTGTPKGASVALPGQTVEVEVSSVDDESISSGRLTTTVVEGPAVGDWGSKPEATDAAKADAWGYRGVPGAQQSDEKKADEKADKPFVLTDELRQRLLKVAVATLSSQLRKRGYDTAFDGCHLLTPGQAFVGTARTLRYVPRRPDITKRIGGGYNAQKRAVDALNAGEVRFRVNSPEDVDKAQAWYEAIGCRTERRKEGFTKGVGDSVRVEDPLGFPYEFFYEVEHVERLAWHYELQGAGALVRLDHFNQVTPDVPRGVHYMKSLGFKVTEDIQDDDGVTYAAWVARKATVHDTAMTGGDGPRMHHVAFATHEKHNILYICDKLGSLRQSDRIERGPGRHGVSNAFYLYLRDADGHRVEIYTQDYYTGDPDNPTATWDVHDNQRRDWWGTPVVPSWYTEASLVLDLDGNPKEVIKRTDASEMAVTIGADGFSYTRKDDKEQGFKLGNTL